MAGREKKPALLKKQNISVTSSKDGDSQIDASSEKTTPVKLNAPKLEAVTHTAVSSAVKPVLKNKKTNQPSKTIKKNLRLQFKAKNKTAKKLKLSKSIFKNNKHLDSKNITLVKNGIKKKPRKGKNKTQETTENDAQSDTDLPPVLEPMTDLPESHATLKKETKKRTKKQAADDASEILGIPIDPKKIKVEIEDKETVDDVLNEVANELKLDIDKLMKKPQAKRGRIPKKNIEKPPIVKQKKPPTPKKSKDGIKGKKEVKSDKIIATLSKDFNLDSDAQNVINKLDLNVTKTIKKEISKKRRHSIEKFPSVAEIQESSNFEQPFSIFTNVRRSASPKSKRNARVRQSVDNVISKRFSPYSTRSDSPARILRNGKHRKLKGSQLLEGLENEYKRRRRLCSEMSVNDLSKYSAEYLSESDSNFSDMTTVTENGLCDITEPSPKEEGVMTKSDLLRKEILESITAPLPEVAEVNLNIKSISTKFTAILKRSLSTETSQLNLDHLQEDIKTKTEELSSNFIDTNSNDVKPQIKTESKPIATVTAIPKAMKSEVTTDGVKVKKEEIDEAVIEKIASSPSYKVPEKSFILDQMKQIFNDSVEEEKRTTRASVKKNIKTSNSEENQETLPAKKIPKTEITSNTVKAETQTVPIEIPKVIEAVKEKLLSNQEEKLVVPETKTSSEKIDKTEKYKGQEKTKECKEPEKTRECKEQEKTKEYKEPEKPGECKEQEKTKECKEPEETRECKELEKTKECKEPKKTRECKEQENTRECKEQEKTRVCIEQGQKPNEEVQNVEKHIPKAKEEKIERSEKECVTPMDTTVCQISHTNYEEKMETGESFLELPVENKLRQTNEKQEKTKEVNEKLPVEETEDLINRLRENSALSISVKETMKDTKETIINQDVKLVKEVNIGENKQTTKEVSPAKQKRIVKDSSIEQSRSINEINEEKKNSETKQVSLKGEEKVDNEISVELKKIIEKISSTEMKEVLNEINIGEEKTTVKESSTEKKKTIIQESTIEKKKKIVQEIKPEEPKKEVKESSIDEKEIIKEVNVEEQIQVGKDSTMEESKEVIKKVITEENKEVTIESKIEENNVIKETMDKNTNISLKELTTEENQKVVETEEKKKTVIETSIEKNKQINKECVVEDTKTEFEVINTEEKEKVVKEVTTPDEKKKGNKETNVEEKQKIILQPSPDEKKKPVKGVINEENKEERKKEENQKKRPLKEINSEEKKKMFKESSSEEKKRPLKETSSEEKRKPLKETNSEEKKKPKEIINEAKKKAVKELNFGGPKSESNKEKTEEKQEENLEPMEDEEDSIENIKLVIDEPLSELQKEITKEQPTDSSETNSEKSVDVVGLDENKEEEQMIVETPENLAIKENILSALGLQSLKAVEQAKLREKPKHSSKNDVYTGTLKTVIKLNRSGEKKKGRNPLKMTLQKSKRSSKDGDSDNSKNDGAFGKNEGENTCYKVMKESGSASGWRHGSHSSDTAGANRKSHYSNRSNPDGSSEQASDTETPEKDGENTTDTKTLVIPEKASSFSIHPGRLCSDECAYCFGKFGLFDTPLHIAQIKSVERQDKILENEVYLMRDSCLCDACYRHVDRRITGSYTSKSYKKTTTATTVPRPNYCHVLSCGRESTNLLRRKWLMKMRKSVTKIINVDLDNTGLHSIPVCSEHYSAVEHLMVCALCKRRLARNHIHYLGSECETLNSALQKEGIPVTLTDKPVVCKLCRYFASLLLKPPSPDSQSNTAEFFRSYKKRLLHFHDIEDETEAEEPPRAPTPTPTPEKEKEKSVEKDKDVLKKKNKTKPSKSSKLNTSGGTSSTGSQPAETEKTDQTRVPCNSENGESRASTPSDTVIDYETLVPNLSLECSDVEEAKNEVPNKQMFRKMQLPESVREAVEISKIMKIKKNSLVERLGSNPSISVRQLFQGEEDLPLQANIDFNAVKERTPEGWEKSVCTIQYDTDTKHLWQELQKPYGNQSSFLRHLILLEKYFRNGDLTLSPNASHHAVNYSVSVQNRLRAYDNIPSNSVPMQPLTMLPFNQVKKSQSGIITTRDPATSISAVINAANLPKNTPIPISQLNPNFLTQLSVRQKTPSVPPGLISLQPGTNRPISSVKGAQQKMKVPVGKNWKPTLIPVTSTSSSSSDKRVSGLVQVISGGKPYHISLQDYNKMCYLKRNQEMRKMAEARAKSEQNSSSGSVLKPVVPRKQKAVSITATTKTSASTKESSSTSTNSLEIVKEINGNQQEKNSSKIMILPKIPKSLTVIPQTVPRKPTQPSSPTLSITSKPSTSKS